MKKMKKFYALLLTAAMTLSMAACGNSSAGTSTTEAASNASESTAETQTDTASSEAAESTASNGDLEDISSLCDDAHLQQPVSCILPAFFVDSQEVSAVVSHQRKKDFHTLFFNF